MSPIKKMPVRDIRRFVDVVGVAYPGFKINTPDDKKRITKYLKKVILPNGIVTMYGYYKGTKILGGMRTFDFTMTFGNVKIANGGLGLVAVDLAHKKEKIAKEMVEYYIRHYRERDVALTSLYPFRPDFYKKMGYGYGTALNQYFFRPSDFPRGDSKKHIAYLTAKDFPAIRACYNRYADRTHGMYRREMHEKGRFERTGLKIVGCKKGRKVEGYLAFSFELSERFNFLKQDMRIEEFVWENRDAFGELATFINTQADQVRRVQYGTQDGQLYHMLFDPRDGNDELLAPLGHRVGLRGVGLMYRVVDVPNLFRKLKDYNFNDADLRLKIEIADSFLPENAGSYVVHFDRGRASVKKRTAATDVTIAMDIADFSSLVTGAIDFRRLYDYRLAEISKTKYVAAVNRLFRCGRKPLCLTQF